jgi:Undecaprenyl-phosphate glucose phosphotransferase
MPEHPCAWWAHRPLRRRARPIVKPVSDGSSAAHRLPHPTGRERSHWLSPRLSRWGFQAAVRLGDVAALFGTGLLVFAMAGTAARWALAWQPPLLTLVSGVVIAACLLQLAASYEARVLLRPGLSLLRAALPWTLACGLFLGLVPGEAQIVLPVLLGWFLAGLAGLGATRWMAAHLARRFAQESVIGSAFVVIGSEAEAARCAEAAARDPRGARVIGAIPARDQGDLATIEPRLLRILHRERVDAVIVALPLAEARLVREAIARLGRLPVRVLLAIDPLMPRAATRRPVGEAEIEGLGLVQVADKPLDGWTWVAKDITDRVLALLALMVAALPMLAIAAGIKLTSPGPVLFRQKREGYGGRVFEILKFRTMRMPDRAAEPSGLVLAVQNDPRTFAFGSFLRRTSLDELPQLINVLRGDMWLVGPRPHSPLACAAGRPYAEVVEDYLARHRMKPGITGWAQVNGWRGPTDTVEQIAARVRHDLDYIENWSPLLDVRILFATVLRGFRDKNAF